MQTKAHTYLIALDPPNRCVSRRGPLGGSVPAHNCLTLRPSMRIRAAVLWDQGQPLSVEAAELDAPGPGEVLVEIKAAGVCHSDLHPARGDWPIKTPLVLGHEGAGIVREVGPSVTKVRPGDHVVLCWAPACGVCPPCREGRRCCAIARRKRTTAIGCRRGPPVCTRATVTWRRSSAPPASLIVVVAEEGAIPVPHDVPFESLATLGCAVLTGVGAVTNAARVPAGSRVAVIGVGGVGLNIVQGARIAAASTSSPSIAVRPVVALDPVRRDAHARGVG
jgi:Zn-dependent alcohol dehydrogenases, class III